MGCGHLICGRGRSGWERGTDQAAEVAAALFFVVVLLPVDAVDDPEPESEAVFGPLSEPDPAEEVVEEESCPVEPDPEESADPEDSEPAEAFTGSFRVPDESSAERESVR
jgi:hypothetical protein